MQAIYGNNFRNRFKNERQIELALIEWERELCKLTLKEIDAGFKAMNQTGDAFPPSLPQFLAYCKGAMVGLRQDTDAYKDFPKLEVLKSDKETAAKHIQELKSKLKKC